MYVNKGNKSVWILILLMLAGVVVGGFIGEYIGTLPYMDWLQYGKPFGFSEPFKLDLGIIQLQFGLVIHFTIAGIIGIVLSIFVYRRWG